MKFSVFFTIFTAFISSISGTNEDCTNINSVTWGDNCYATIDWTDPNDMIAACQNDYMTVPNEWQIADYEEGIEDFIYNYGWGTHVVVLSNGDGYGTATYVNGVWNSNMLLDDGLGGYKPGGCSLRVFISRSTGPQPSSIPTAEPTPRPTAEPTVRPTTEPTPRPTAEPTSRPSLRPTAEPTSRPSLRPTSRPTGIPTIYPTSFPTAVPIPAPSQFPTSLPTYYPTSFPTSVPIPAPSQFPTSLPTYYPTSFPTTLPTSVPIPAPSQFPTGRPTPSPSISPTSIPTSIPTITSSEKKTNSFLYSIIYHWGIITFLIIISSCMVCTCLGCLYYIRTRFEANLRNTSYSQAQAVRIQDPVVQDQEPVVIGEIQLSERALENKIVLI